LSVSVDTLGEVSAALALVARPGWRFPIPNLWLFHAAIHANAKIVRSAAKLAVAVDPCVVPDSCVAALRQLDIAG
jgi:hypothetical protein